MTTPSGKGPVTTKQIAEDAHSIAEDLHVMAQNNERNRWLALALSLLAGAVVLLVVLVIFVLVPVLQTARIVQQVAGPDAIAQQQEQGAATLSVFGAFLVCITRENTSEARVMDGKTPLHLRNGCPPYNFNDDAPLVPNFPTVTTAPKHKTTTTTGTR